MKILNRLSWILALSLFGCGEHAITLDLNEKEISSSSSIGSSSIGSSSDVGNSSQTISLSSSSSLDSPSSSSSVSSSSMSDIAQSSQAMSSSTVVVPSSSSINVPSSSSFIASSSSIMASSSTLASSSSRISSSSLKISSSSLASSSSVVITGEQLLNDYDFDASASIYPWEVWSASSSVGTITKINNAPYGYDMVFTPKTMTNDYDLQLRQTYIPVKKGYRYWVSLGGNTLSPANTRSVNFGLQRTTTGYVPYFAFDVTMTSTYTGHSNEWSWENCTYTDSNAQFYINGGSSTKAFKIAWITLWAEPITCP